MIKKYFSNITLFTVLVCFCLTGIIITAISHQPPEIKSWLLVRLAIATLVLFIVDVVIKNILKLHGGWLWAVQILLLLIALYLWIISD